MAHEQLHNGDVIYAAKRIVNDGSVPGAGDNEVFAEKGTMGMLINVGHFEVDPNQELFLVCFKNEIGELGVPVTCLADEISSEPVTANSQYPHL